MSKTNSKVKERADFPGAELQILSEVQPSFVVCNCVLRYFFNKSCFAKLEKTLNYATVHCESNASKFLRPVAQFKLKIGGLTN